MFTIFDHGCQCGAMLDVTVEVYGKLSDNPEENDFEFRIVNIACLSKRIDIVSAGISHCPDCFTNLYDSPHLFDRIIRKTDELDNA
jgi:hypothetical protein